MPLLLSALVATALASAQGPSNPNEAKVYGAYLNQRTGTGYVFEMTGTETLGRIASNVHAILYYRLSNDPRTGAETMAQAELDVFRPTNGGETLAYRMVGDGNTLYRYDVDRREVSATLYGAYGVAPINANVAAAFPHRLLSQLRAVTPGLSTYLVRLMDELNPIGALYGPRYANWLPGGAIANFDAVPPPLLTVTDLRPADTVTDPITARTYVRGDEAAQQYVFYGMNGVNAPRTVAFRIYDARGDKDNPLWKVQTVNVAMKTPGRTIDLTLTPNETTAFPDGAFQPYTGAQGAMFRPVVAKG